MEPITVKYKVLDARAKVPAYATPGAAAADLCAVLDAPLTVAPMQRVLVPTGLAIELPGALAVDYGVAYFTLETREEAAAILDMIRTHAPFEGDFTRGLYFKGTN